MLLVNCGRRREPVMRNGNIQHNAISPVAIVTEFRNDLIYRSLRAGANNDMYAQLCQLPCGFTADAATGARN